ncbi:hypothetical protein CcrC1_gp051c [Caulobacter phage C1]|nr:hypothetical protein CcrC1_gp051c [Caulobacter phage C1]UTU08278.1 hypothetical protein CcrC2_gp050c [Caulobacter phage C2]UTU08801.1 hypothetical protein CcrJ4_gp050c [Caulobacter phage J4]UTU09353.1 hypothetical protein CcrBL47_gp067c [Caulobacter phage BL47]UTU09913.1 hypothetical protein CcrRB23_gp051c [Caulobacter phage RB23]WGN96938.1 hypothetical protein [Bertelyvirus sp.]
MGFDRAMVDVSCDKCKTESEPVEAFRAGGPLTLSLEEAKTELEVNGWRVNMDGDLTCPDCVYDEENPDDEDDDGVQA